MVRLVLSFLGTFQVQLDQSPVSGFRSGKNAGLLAYLALNHQQPISRQRLSALFWPEEPRKTARHNLRQALYRLRRLLHEQQPSDQPFLLLTHQSVQFNPNSSYRLDVEQFLTAVDTNNLDTAVTHYTGDLLAGFTCNSHPFEEWLRLEREHLHQLALEVFSAAAQDHLQAGQLDRVQTLARRQLKLEPWREQAHRQLMQAYALAGDRASALAQFDRCREQLWEHIGVEPAPETMQTRAEITAGHLGTHTTERSRPAPARAHHNLPAETAPLIGREAETADIQQVLAIQTHRLVSILGPGGMGKTRLGLVVARNLLEHFQDGVYFIDLSAADDAEEIAPAIAAVLNYEAPDKSTALLPQLIRTLSRLQLLLLLDNFEQVTNGAAIVNQLLQACPELAVLVTSRRPLDLDSEYRYRLSGLRFTDRVDTDAALTVAAVQLFVESGRRVRPNFELTDANVADVLHICRLVQGMPLALRLAASWLELLTTADIAREIETGIDILAAEWVSLPARQRSMRATFEQSWQRLEKQEQTVLARLSVFRGGFTREAAEKVAGANLRILLSLVNQSLLQRQPDGSRFVLHELLRQYVAEQRNQLALDNASRMAHCRTFSRLMGDEAHRGLSFWPQHLPRQMAADRDNIQHAWRFAVQHSLANELSTMARGVAAFSSAQGVPPAPILEEAIQALRHQGTPETNRELLHLRLIAATAWEFIKPNEQILANILAVVPMLEAHGTAELCFWAFERLAHLFNAQQKADALIWTERAIAVTSKTGDDLLAHMAAALDLWIRIDQGRYDDSTAVALHSLLAYLEPNFPTSHLVYGILWASGVYYAANGDPSLAIQYAKRSKHIAREWQSLLWISHSTVSLVKIYQGINLTQEAASELVDCLDWHLAIGQRWQTLGFLYGVSLFRVHVFADRAAAATIISMAYHHEDVTPHMLHNIAANRSLLASQMEPDVFAAAWEKGKTIDFTTAVALFRTTLTGSDR